MLDPHTELDFIMQPHYENKSTIGHIMHDPNYIISRDVSNTNVIVFGLM